MLDVYVGRTASDNCDVTTVTTCFNFRMSTAPAQSVPVRCETSGSGEEEGDHIVVAVFHHDIQTPGRSFSRSLSPFNLFSAGTDFRRQNIPFQVDSSTEKVKYL